MSPVYQPKMGLGAKITRRLSNYRHRHIITPKLDRPIVSFSFDDCPRSVIENALPLLEAENWRATFYMACGLCDTINHLGRHMSLKDIQAVHTSGHEIGDHTYDHLDIGNVSLETYLDNIALNQTKLTELGIPESRTFAYPYGSVSPNLKQALYANFELSRGVVESSGQTLDLGLCASTRLYSGSDTNTAIKRIQTLSKSPRWEILFTHDVRDNPSEYGCTKTDMMNVIKAVKDSGAIVLPVAAALDYMRPKL